MAKLPRKLIKVRSSKTEKTKPLSFMTVMDSPSKVAMPADS
jgi:hypothetical protein